jgi:hypothetical protein
MFYGTPRKQRHWFFNLENWKGHHFEEETIDLFIKKLMNTPLEAIQESFQLEEYSGDNLRYIYFKDIDEYFPCSGGNHRTLFAKITNAPYILAKVEEHEKDHKKNCNYDLIQSRKNYLEALIKQLNLTKSEKENSSDEEFYLIYKNISLLYVKIPSIKDYTDKDSERFHEVYEAYKRAIYYLKDLESKDFYYSKIPFRNQLLKVINAIQPAEGTIAHLKNLYAAGWKRRPRIKL